MHIEGLKHKIYVACVGMPDCGKSTFIKSLVQYITKRRVNVDSFCDEQKLDMTIRSAQIFLRDKYIPYDIVFLDCPGHIFEYQDEARSVLSKAHFLIHIVNDKQQEIIPYNDNYISEDKWCSKLTELMGENLLDIVELHSHSSSDDCLSYDANGIDFLKFDGIFKNIVKFIDQKKYVPIDPIETACRIITKTCDVIHDSKVAMCSFGKDSILMLQLMKMTGCLSEIKIEYPNSGFDLSGISTEFRNHVCNFFGCDIEPFDVIENGWNFENHTTQEMMLCKARKLTERINRFGYKACFTGIRRDEEGTRAKEKFFSPRNHDGSFDYLNPQKEIFGYEFPTDLYEKYPQLRVNPLLDLCEADVWFATRHFGLPICSEYFSVNGMRYRSLGDYPITTPIESCATTIDEICREVDETLIPERVCRSKQDNCIQFGMEKLRKVGFF